MFQTEQSDLLIKKACKKVHGCFYGFNLNYSVWAKEFKSSHWICYPMLIKNPLSFLKTETTNEARAEAACGLCRARRSSFYEVNKN